MITGYNPIIGVLSSFLRDRHRDNLIHKERMTEIYSQSEVINKLIDTINENQKDNRLNIESIISARNELLVILKDLLSYSIRNKQTLDTEICKALITGILTTPVSIPQLNFPIDKINFNNSFYTDTNTNYNKLELGVTHSKRGNNNKSKVVDII